MSKAVLMIEVGVGENESDALSIKCGGTPNQVLGFIERAEHELGKLRKRVLTDLDNKEVVTHV